jgi:hypothetical protein
METSSHAALGPGPRATKLACRFSLLASRIMGALLGLLALGTAAGGAEGAGEATVDPGFTYPAAAPGTRDVLAGDSYYYVQNELARATISMRTGANNGAGTFQQGYLADFAPTSQNVETLDWTQLLISRTILDGWDYPQNNVALGAISVADGQRVIVSGAWLADPQIQMRTTYEMLPSAPILRIALDLTNTGATDFAGFLEYQIDPDGTENENAYVPGLGWEPGLARGGWTDRYLYAGPVGVSTYPGHGIAWYANTPAAVNAPGYLLGAIWEVRVPAGGQRRLTFYHIVDAISATGQPFEGIAAWAALIPILDATAPALQRVHGTIAAAGTGQALAGAAVLARNLQGQVKGTATSDLSGQYSILLPPDVYTLTVTALGHDSASRTLNLLLDEAVDFALTPITVWAGPGKQLAGPLVEGTTNDLVLENRKLAMAVAVVHEDPQLAGTTRGKPIDLAVQGLPDGVDWLNLPCISLTEPQGTEAWAMNTVATDTVQVVENTPQYAVVKTGGIYTEVNDVAVETVYTIRPEEPYIHAVTTITNGSGQPLPIWVGDVIDDDEDSQTSFVPGSGAITTDYDSPAAYPVTMPWIAQYGASEQCFGLIYEDDFAGFSAYGTGGWIQSRKQVEIPAGGVYRFGRYIVAVATTGLPDKSAAVEEVYHELLSRRTGLEITASLDRDRLAVGESVTVRLQARNVSDATVQGYRATLDLPGQLGTDDPWTVALGSLAPQSSVEAAWVLTALSGGRCTATVTVTKPQAYPTSRRLYLAISGPGWYSGDDHVHSTWSDGTGTIAQNVAAARTNGLDWVTGTDSNTVRPADELAAESTVDFVALCGNEVSASYGHALAYDVNVAVDWTLPPQQMIDALNAGNNGHSFLYLAHPFYPGLEWGDWDITGYVGLEVWNGLYGPKDPANAQAFDQWDALNRQGRHLYGLAGSDAHNVAQIGAPRICAYLNELTRAEILRALRTGAYYGTNGPALHFGINGHRMSADVPLPAGGTVTIELGGMDTELLTSVQLLKNGAALRTWAPDALGMSVTVSDQAAPGDFYRVVVESQTGYAFSNPIWIAGGP